MWGYYGIQYRVRLYPPFGYSILYKEYYLTRLNHQKNTTQLILETNGAYAGVDQDLGL